MKATAKETKSRYAILGMLSLRPMSGYDIKKTVEESIGNFWSESYGQIYPILKKLTEEELVTKTIEDQAGKPDRHLYLLTEKGSKELHRWLMEGVVPRVERNELLLKVFFASQISPATTADHIRNYRKIQQDFLDSYARICEEIVSERSGSPNLEYWLMTLSYGRRVTQAIVDWCDESLETLAGLPKK